MIEDPRCRRCRGLLAAKRTPKGWVQRCTWCPVEPAIRVTIESERHDTVVVPVLIDAATGRPLP